MSRGQDGNSMMPCQCDDQSRFWQHLSDYEESAETQRAFWAAESAFWAEHARHAPSGSPQPLPLVSEFLLLHDGTMHTTAATQAEQLAESSSAPPADAVRVHDDVDALIERIADNWQTLDSVTPLTEDGRRWLFEVLAVLVNWSRGKRLSSDVGKEFVDYDPRVLDSQPRH